MRFIILLFSLVIVSLMILDSASAQISRGDVLVISSPQAPLYSNSDESSRTNSVLQSGRRVKAIGPSENGFVPLATKSGRAWIRENDVMPEGPVAGEVLEPREERSSESRFGLGIERITFDLGGSFGQVNDISYTEVNLGLNTYFSEYFAWRNAVFGRFVEKSDNIYGLDTSLRGILSVSGVVAGFTIFAGPGYRFVSQGDNVPLAEAGLVFRLAGISLGGGVKTLLTSWVKSGAPNDTQYFLILAGGGSL